MKKQNHFIGEKGMLYAIQWVFPVVRNRIMKEQDTDIEHEWIKVNLNYILRNDKFKLNHLRRTTLNL